MYPESVDSAINGTVEIKDIGYANKSSITEKLMKESLAQSFTLHGFESVEKLEAWAESNDFHVGAVIFDESLVSPTESRGENSL